MNRMVRSGSEENHLHRNGQCKLFAFLHFPNLLTVLRLWSEFHRQAAPLMNPPSQSRDPIDRSRVGASHLLDPDWPGDHPLILAKEQTRQWTRPVTDQDRKQMATAALKAFIRDRAPALGLPLELRHYGMMYIKAGAYSQIRRLMVNEAPSGWMVELPTDLDERKRGIEENHKAFAHYHQIGRTRYLPKPAYLFRSEASAPDAGDDYTVSLHEFFDGYQELNFGMGTLRRWDVTNKAEPMIPLPEERVPHLLAEMMAILVYHYELDPADSTRGTSIGGIHINAGDMILRKGGDDGSDLRLITARKRCPGISLPKFVQSLVQMATAEELVSDRDKVDTVLGFRAELPVLISNPSIAFHGITRGLTYLHEDLGNSQPAQTAAAEARRWLDLFVTSEAGQPYEPWVTRFLEGDLPLSYWSDPREGNPDPQLLPGMLTEFQTMQRTGQHFGDPRALELVLQHLESRISTLPLDPADGH
jgi:hypothetical protein